MKIDKYFHLYGRKNDVVFEEVKWTPVTEALPEEDLDVLVTVRFDGNKDVPPSLYVETGCYMDDNWISDSDEYKVSPKRHHVIAWMLLPEPYRGDR